MDKGPLVAVPVGPLGRGQFVKMYRAEAEARGYGAEKPESRMEEERIKKPEAGSRKPEAETEETPLPVFPTTQDVVGEGEEAEPVVQRPKRRPQGRNKMMVAEEDKGRSQKPEAGSRDGGRDG